MRRRRLILAALIFLWPSLWLMALNPDAAISSYAHSSWRLQDGYLRSLPMAITQTRDGYIWIGTSTGLFRFDGVTFTPWQPPKWQQPLSGAIYSLLGASDGSLWIGTTVGFIRWKDGQWTRFSDYGGAITSMAEDKTGAIWVARSLLGSDRRGPLCRVLNKRVRCFGAADGIPFTESTQLTIDATGAIWLAGLSSVLRYSPEAGVTVYSAPYPFPKILQSAVSSMSGDSSGGIWVSFYISGKGLGLEYLQNGKFSSSRVPHFDTSRLKVDTTFIDRSGSLWVGTGNDGLYRIKDDRVEHFSSNEGLSGDEVDGFLEDAEGDIWVLTSKGIDRFHDLSILTLARAQHLGSYGIASVLANRDGSIWSMSYERIDILKDGSITTIDRNRGLPGKLAEASLEDREGRIWIGIDNGLYQYSRGAFLPVVRSDKKDIGPVLSLAQDTDGLIWVVKLESGQNSLSHFDPKHRVAELANVQPGEMRRVMPDIHSGVWALTFKGDVSHIAHQNTDIIDYKLRPKGQEVLTMLQGSDGTVYIWSTSGLTLIKGKESKFLPGSPNDPCLNTYSGIFDRDGSMWVSSRCALTRYTAKDVNGWWQASNLQVHDRLDLDPSDGYVGSGPYYYPEVDLAPDGKLWFATPNGLQTLDPRHLALNLTPPSVHIESLLADRQQFPISEDTVILPARTRNLQIDYTALSFPAPQKVMFRYRLQGHDTDWQDAGIRRQAFFNNLPPGPYSFQVIACNNSGIWNEQGATLKFVVLPAWYQKLWVQLVAVAAVIGLLIVFYLLRIRAVENELTLRFDERMTERMRIARELHDTLLQALNGLALSFSNFVSRVDAAPEVHAEMETALDRADQLMISGRDRIRDLRGALDGAGDLKAELDAMARDASPDSKPNVTVSVDGVPKYLNPVVQDEILWIAKEALTNACRHSSAKWIHIQVSYERNELRISVRDNGQGMDASLARRAGHFGLVGMHERAEGIGGKLSIKSTEGGGTSIGLAVPGRIAFQKMSGWHEGIALLGNRKNLKRVL